MKTIAVLGTFDTKGVEHRFVADEIARLGFQPLLIDVGAHGVPQISTDITREQVAAAISLDLIALRSQADRGTTVEAMTKAAPVLLARLASEGRIHGVISLGGSGGTSIGTAAMRGLPLGFPKVMVSTVAAGNVAPYLGSKDIILFPSIVDVAGLNRISRAVFARAAATVCALVEANSRLDVTAEGRPLIVASMFGNTTQCVEHARMLLENQGFEVLVFHATGTGGRTMESLIESRAVSGVLDITTTEWADELVGGVLSAGPTRLEAAARFGIPAVVTPGCLDMVNFGPRETVPARFADRKFYQHNPQITLMRTTPKECAELGRIIAEKVNLSTGPVSVLWPRKAISIISATGKPFDDREADEALRVSLQSNLRKDIPFRELDREINEPAFAEACVVELLSLLKIQDRG
ncbi:MAG: Tm-1-like ATP-binding domain-containing protein [Verrucomicrobiota bacterium]